MALKKSTCAILIFVGYAAVGFAMENDNKIDSAAVLRKYGAPEQYIENTLKIAERNKTPKDLVKEFHRVDETFDTIDEISEFVDIKDSELPLEYFPENKQTSVGGAVASTIGTYYNWLTGNKK